MSKRKSFPFSYIIMIAVAAFAAWVYFAEYKGGEEREKQKVEEAGALPFSNADVTEISIQAAGQEIALKKEGPKDEIVWRVLKPYADLGDTTAIDNFLSTLSAEKTTETVVEAADIAWKTYGLDSPSTSVMLKAKTATGEKTRTIQVGSVPAFDGSVYVRIDNANKVMLMSSTTKAAIEKDAREFRDKRFFPVAIAPDFVDVKISRPGQSDLRFVLKDEVWVEASAKPGSWPLDQNAVKSYLNAVSGLRGNDVWAEDKTDVKVLKARKLDKPGLVVTLTPERKIVAKPEPPYEVKIATMAKEESVAAGVGSARPLVFSVYKPQVDALSKSADDFRDLKFPFLFTIANVRGVELERPKGEVSLPILVKKDGKWAIDPMDQNFQGRELNTEAVDRLMVGLTSLEAKKMLPKLTPKPKASDKGSVRIGMFGEKSQKIAEFVFSPVAETYRVTSTLTPNYVFEIEKAQFEALALDLVKAKP